MSSALEERLKSNSSAFDGLLSLIPAKYYYDDDTQDQWQAKKKSKEETKQIKRAKLDPNETSDKISTAAQVLSKKAKVAKPVVIPGKKEVKGQQQPQPQPQDDASDEENINIVFDDEGNEIELNKKREVKEITKKDKSPEEVANDKKKKAESINQLREKLAAKINTLKEKRKAPGVKVNGVSSSRETILAERRRKAELKAEKKRKLAELEKDDEDEEEEDSESEDSEDEFNETADNVLYQNIQFDDNTKTTSDLTNIRKFGKKKGPSNKDIKGHLKLLELKKEKQLSFDSDKLKKLEEKEKWNRSLLQAEGIKIKDDEKLLKKALKRKEAQKRKSEIQWQERKDHVQNMISAKQKRREENLQIRKDNKGIKRKNQTKQKRKFKSSIAPKRAGFEGKMKRK